MNEAEIATKLRQEQLTKQIDGLIEAHGYATISYASPEKDALYPYHYTVGLTALGFPEIFVSGRLDARVAQTIVQRMVHQWKERKKAKVGTYPSFIKGTVGLKMPVRVFYADVGPKTQEDARFLDIYYQRFPGVPANFVQIIWPDQHGHLPDTKWYETDSEYMQEMLPELPRPA